MIAMIGYGLQMNQSALLLSVRASFFFYPLRFSLSHLYLVLSHLLFSFKKKGKKDSFSSSSTPRLFFSGAHFDSSASPVFYIFAFAPPHQHIDLYIYRSLFLSLERERARICMDASVLEWMLLQPRRRGSTETNKQKKNTTARSFSSRCFFYAFEKKR